MFLKFIDFQMGKVNASFPTTLSNFKEELRFDPSVGKEIEFQKFLPC